MPKDHWLSENFFVRESGKILMEGGGVFQTDTGTQSVRKGLNSPSPDSIPRGCLFIHEGRHHRGDQ